MRIAAACFLGFTLYIVITIAVALTLHPPSIDLEYFIKMVVFTGGFAVWSAAATWQLWKHGRCATGYALAGFLTLILLIGWAQNDSLQLNEPVHPLMGALRTIGGLFVVLLWVSLIRASIVGRSPATVE